MMSNAEIVRSYRNAENKSKQIGILAELNATDKQTIKGILLAEGVELPKPGRKASKPKEEVAVTPEPEARPEPANNQIPNTVRILTKERLDEIATKVNYHRDRIIELERERRELEEFLGEVGYESR